MFWSVFQCSPVAVTRRGRAKDAAAAACRTILKEKPKNKMGGYRVRSARLEAQARPGFLLTAIYGYCNLKKINVQAQAAASRKGAFSNNPAALPQLSRVTRPFDDPG